MSDGDGFSTGVLFTAGVILVAALSVCDALEDTYHTVEVSGGRAHIRCDMRNRYCDEDGYCWEEMGGTIDEFLKEGSLIKLTEDKNLCVVSSMVEETLLIGVIEHHKAWNSSVYEKDVIMTRRLRERGDVFNFKVSN